MRQILCLFFFFLSIATGNSQVSFEEGWFHRFEQNVSALSLQADRLNRPFIYVASNESGLIVLNTSGIFIAQLSKADLGLEVMNVFQEGNVLYLALGSHFASGSPAGIASLDISDPTNPTILDNWRYETANQSNGMGDLLVKDGILYAGAMGSGLLILDVLDPSDIQLISSLQLSNDFPVPNPANPDLYNARGLTIKDDLVYVAYDAGGLRVIDVSESIRPIEVGAYANPITYTPINRPRAYNNVIIVDSIAFVAVDYCGVEVLNVANPLLIQIMDHYNPVNCPEGNWFNAAVHTNELALDAECAQLFVAAGRSELLSFDVSDPADIFLNGSFGSIDDTMATWGLDYRNDSLFLGYLTIPIYVPFLHPFDAKGSGVKMIAASGNCDITSDGRDLSEEQDVEVYPNPGKGKFHIQTAAKRHGGVLKVYDLWGRLVERVDLEADGSTYVELKGESEMLFFLISGLGQYQTKRVINLQ